MLPYNGKTCYTTNMRTSILNDQEAVTSAVASANSIKHALEILGLRPAGGNYKALISACERYNLSVPRANTKYQTSSASAKRARANDEIFIENSDYANRANIKRRLFSMGIPEECAICGQGPIWNGLPLTLQLDHINGIGNDNRLENLRILCGHCHSQTDTYCGKNHRRT
jgi:Fe2+ transport system protein FeoA